MEFLVGGVAASAASFFTNPLEVVKTRLQLQGELKARGHYAVHYRNVFHALIAIGRVDGILALQKGLVPAVWYQFIMNGARLGAYQWMANRHLLTNADGMLSFPRCIVAGALAGSLGSFIASPTYMVKTQLQAMAAKEIAVGYQHKHKGMADALMHVYSSFGIWGLWRGVSGAVSRVMVGSAAQLSTFSAAKQYITNLHVFPAGSYMIAFIASMLSGVNTVLFMTPFDVVSTRLYNQGTDAHGKGLNYRGVLDCFVKTFWKEGFTGFYKGWQASLFRVGPHTVLSLIFWDELQKFSTRYQKKQ